jgi:hypothetical protein
LLPVDKKGVNGGIIQVGKTYDPSKILSDTQRDFEKADWKTRVYMWK